MVDLIATEFHFNAGPAAIVPLHDGVDFKSGVVAVMEYLRVMKLGVDAQIPHNEALEKEAEEVEIAE